MGIVCFVHVVARKRAYGGRETVSTWVICIGLLLWNMFSGIGAIQNGSQCQACELTGDVNVDCECSASTSVEAYKHVVFA